MSYNQIIKTTDKRILYFFQNDGLCVKNLLKPYENYKIIYENAVHDFDVIEMESEELAIICQDDKGSIIILKENDDSFLKTTLLNNRSQVPYEKNFKLLRHNKWLSLNYVLSYQGNYILSHQLLDDENVEPIVIDYITDCNTFSFVNKNYDLYCFYNKKNEFGYKIFKWSKKQWEDFIPLGNGKFITGINDWEDNVYLIYEENNKYFVRIIKNKEFDMELKTVEIDFIHQNDKVNLLIEKNNLWITVDRSGFIFGIKSDLDFKDFSNMYSFIKEGKLILYSISFHEKDFKMYHCFGYEINYKPQLILYKDLLNSSKTIIPPKIVETEEEIKQIANIETMKESLESIEINKLKIMFKDVENKVKKLNQRIVVLENNLKKEASNLEEENKN